MRLVLEATLEAVGAFLGGACRLALNDFSVVRLAGRDVAVVAVSCVESRGEKVLTGSCLAEEDIQQALVFAVLDAVNRLVGKMEPVRRVEYEVGPASAA